MTIFSLDWVSVSPMLASWLRTIYQPKLSVKLPGCKDHPILNPHRQAQCSVTLSSLRSTTSLSFLLLRCWQTWNERARSRPVYILPLPHSYSFFCSLCFLCLTVVITDTKKNWFNIYRTARAPLPLLVKKNLTWALSCGFVLQRFAGATNPATGSPPQRLWQDSA